MLLTSQQVAEKLGVSRGVVLAMTRRGELTPVNKPIEGKKKFYPKYQSKDINSFKKTNRTPKRARSVKQPVIGGFITELREMRVQLNRIEAAVSAIQKWF